MVFKHVGASKLLSGYVMISYCDLLIVELFKIMRCLLVRRFVASLVLCSQSRTEFLYRAILFII